MAAIREEFLITGTPTTNALRPIILESWQRCRRLQVNPGRRQAPLAVTKEVQVRELREAGEQLVQAARPVLDHLAELLADSGYVIVVTDAQGCILDLVGDLGVRRRLARIDFVPGGEWSEAAAGTNAIGTALADGRAMQLMAAEHFCAGWQDLTCTAAPIRHPLTGALIGVLDITGDYHLIRSHLTSLLAVGALEIEQGLRILLTSGQGRKRLGHMQGPRAPVQNGARTPAYDAGDFGEGAPKGDEWPHASILEDDVRSRLLRQERRARDAELLAAAGGAISASLDKRVTLERAAEQTALLLQLDGAAVCLFDALGDGLSLHSWSRPTWPRPELHRALEALLRQTNAAAVVRERGQPVVLDEVLAAPVLPVTRGTPVDIGSLALLPLATARGITGFIAAPRRTVYHWTVEDLRLGLAFAAQAATAIENAHLFETLQQQNRHMEALHAVAQVLGTVPDPTQELDLVLGRIMEIMGLDVGLVWLLDASTGQLGLVAHRGLPGSAIRDLHEHPPRSSEGVVGQVAATGEPIRIGGVGGDGGPMPSGLCAEGFHEAMAVPLAASGAILGVLLVGSHSLRAVTGDDLTLFTAVGQQLGLSLKNVLLLRTATEMDALREADRLKSEFLATVSHDLRSPLTAIRISVEGLLDHGAMAVQPGMEGKHPPAACRPSSPDALPGVPTAVRQPGGQAGTAQEHLLHTIASQAGRLGRLVDQLLDLTRITARALTLDREWIELPAVITDAITEIAGLAGTCPVEHAVPPNTPLLFADRDRLVQVLYNLLENACKYAPPDATIRVEVNCTQSEALIAVADRGPGIPAHERDAIFRRFYRARDGRRSPVQGTGLGLAICKGVVEAHGGRIWVEDRPGGGSVFRIALPLPVQPPGELGASA